MLAWAAPGAFLSSAFSLMLTEHLLVTSALFLQGGLLETEGANSVVGGCVSHIAVNVPSAKYSLLGGILRFVQSLLPLLALVLEMHSGSSVGTVLSRVTGTGRLSLPWVRLGDARVQFSSCC